MKKLITILILFLTIINIFSDDLVYEVIHNEFDDLENPWFTDSIVFYKDSFYEISINKFTFITTNKIFYTIEIIYIGDDWRFLSGEIKIKTDENLYKIYVDDPYHSVLSGGNVFELIQAKIDLIALNDIANTEILRMQFYCEPIDIPSENISLIKRFYDEYPE